MSVTNWSSVVVALGGAPLATLFILTATAVMLYGLYRMSQPGKLSLAERKLIGAFSFAAFVLLLVPASVLALNRPSEPSLKATPQTQTTLAPAPRKSAAGVGTAH
jgi:hypothetical protein